MQLNENYGHHTTVTKAMEEMEMKRTLNFYIILMCAQEKVHIKSRSLKNGFVLLLLRLLM